MPQKNRSKQGLSMEVELTEKQKEFARVMMDDKTKVVFLNGCAGSGKTFLAVHVALCLLNKGSHEKILYLRTPIETGRSLGALKGFLDEKIAVYLDILKEKLYELLTPDQVTKLIKEEVVEGDVINFIRGKSISDTVIIFDEASNATNHEIETVLSRANKNTKVFLCGDTRQSDIKNNKYDEICELFDDEESVSHGIYHFQFGREDIMRDPVIGYILDKLENLY